VSSEDFVSDADMWIRSDIELGAGPNFFITPLHRAPYVLCVLDVCFHLDVPYVALAIHISFKYMF
jgi:hypothetical protein